jgi:hypothetical protein
LYYRICTIFCYRSTGNKYAFLMLIYWSDIYTVMFRNTWQESDVARVDIKRLLFSPGPSSWSISLTLRSNLTAVREHWTRIQKRRCPSLCRDTKITSVMTQEIKFVSQGVEVCPITEYTCKFVPTVLSHTEHGNWYFTCTRCFCV